MWYIICWCAVVILREGTNLKSWGQALISSEPACTPQGFELVLFLTQ